jgi:hypothetical protein
VDAVRPVYALLDRCAQLVESRDDAALVVRDDQPHGHEALGEALGDPGSQGVQPLPASSGDLERAREAIREPSAPQRVDPVDLVHNELDRELGRADLVKDRLDRGNRLVQPLVCHRGVGDVENELGGKRLLEGGGEALDQLVRKAADESDRVGDEVAAPVVVEAPRRRVECLEEPVVHRDVGVGQGVQEGRLAGIGVAGEGDHGRVASLPGLPLRLAPALKPPQALPEHADSSPRQPAVGLELRLARAARPDPTSEPLEMLPHAAHPREVVLELGELDLELSFGRHRVLGEDVEDELRPVDDTQLELVLEPPLLARVEIVVHDQRLGVRVADGTAELGKLSLAHVRAGIGGRPALNELADGYYTRRAEELAKLGQLVLDIRALRHDGSEEAALGLGPWRGIRLALTHGWIMPA